MRSYAERARGLYLETGARFPASIVRAVALVKWAVARANREHGVLPAEIAGAIEEAALKLARTLETVEVDVYQTGSGTGLNMAVNEIIAERASSTLGRRVHPNDHVNRGQSSNDVIPTAVRVALALESTGLDRALAELEDALALALERYGGLVKEGRTHLRDALPVTLGLWLSSYKSWVALVLERLERAREALLEVPLGGTAVGTGAGSSRRVAERALELLARETGLPLRPARPRSRAMRLTLDLVDLSSSIRLVALLLWRLAQDVRLMYSGPRNGLAEIDLEITLPGSSMMPGKRNPVTSESVMQAAARILGLDHAVAQGALLGELELGLSWPLTGATLHEMIALATEATRKMAQEIRRIRPRRERMREQAMTSPALATLLAPHIGYEEAARAAQLLLEGETLESIAKRYGLDPERLWRDALGWETGAEDKSHHSQQTTTRPADRPARGPGPQEG